MKTGEIILGLAAAVSLCVMCGEGLDGGVTVWNFLGLAAYMGICKAYERRYLRKIK